MVRNIALLVAAPLALGMAQVMAAPTATNASATVTCTPKIRGLFKAIAAKDDGSTPDGTDGPYYPINVSPSNSVTDSQGAKSSLLTVDDYEHDEAWDFLQCDSAFMGLTSTDDIFYGQLRKVKGTIYTGLADPSKLSSHCMTTVATDLSANPDDYNTLKQTQFSNSKGCDVDDITQTQRFFSAQYDPLVGGYRIQFVGAKKAQELKYPGHDQPKVTFKRDSVSGPLYITYIQNDDQDRKRAVGSTRRDDAASGAFSGNHLAILGQPISS